MLQPVFEIIINNGREEIKFNFVNSFEIEETYENLTQTAKVIIPRKLKFEGIDLFAGQNPLFKRGDSIQINAGYYPRMRKLFTGYISKVHAKIPIELECEDEMWLLKQYEVSYPQKTYKQTLGKNGKPLRKPKVYSDKITLNELLSHILTTDIKCANLDKTNYFQDINLGQFRMSNATPAQALEVLKENYGLYSYFKEGVLYVGFANNASTTNEVKLYIEKQVINLNDLEWMDENDIRIKVKAVSIQDDNSKIEVEVGDPDGEQRTIHKHNMNAADLKEVAEAFLTENKYTGFQGDLVTFGEPYATFGDRVNLVSTKLPEQNGVYLISKVKRTLSVGGGFRQIKTLGEKVG
jgi:hypothetical protein